MAEDTKVKIEKKDVLERASKKLPLKHRRWPKSIVKMISSKISRAESEVDRRKRHLKQAREDLVDAENSLRIAKAEETLVIGHALQLAAYLPEDSKIMKEASKEAKDAADVPQIFD